MHEYSLMVEHREPMLKHCFGFVVGVWMEVQNPPDPEVQNAYYNVCWYPPFILSLFLSPLTPSLVAICLFILLHNYVQLSGIGRETVPAMQPSFCAVRCASTPVPLQLS